MRASAAFVVWKQKNLAFDSTFQCCSFKKDMATDLDRDLQMGPEKKSG